MLEENKQQIKEKHEIYKQRQAIVEHPFGIIKRQWDFYYVMTKKGKKRASSDVGLIFTAFNLRRIFNILNPNTLKNQLRVFAYYFLSFRSDFKSFLASENSKLYFLYWQHNLKNWLKLA